MKSVFLYKITNKINNKCYVGFTSFTIEKRYQTHLYKSNCKSYNQRLYIAMRKYGEENFVVEQIYQGDDALQREEEFIKKYKAEYNMAEGGLGGRHTNPHRPYGNSNRAKEYIVTHPDGLEEVIYNVAEFARKHNLSRSSICQVCKGGREHTKGFRFKYKEN